MGSNERVDIMGEIAGRDSTLERIKVAVNIRPLMSSERRRKEVINVIAGEPKVQIGNRGFAFDHVYGSTGLPSSFMYDDCVAPLIEALFRGYNSTVLAYGQTGSGKTYMMGTGHSSKENQDGIIPKVIETIFERIETLEANSKVLIKVSIVEILKEVVLDLLAPNPQPFMKNDGVRPVKLATPTKFPILIRESMNGGITLSGVTEAVVRSKEEMLSLLVRGSQSRATGRTDMNSQSSRSHAIFTFTIEQKKRLCCCTAINRDGFGDDILSGKLHLVDLAGSRRAKRIGADGTQFKEVIGINKGLLALGNVISALSVDKKQKDGSRVPYRNSKLTRLLQDSIGGNSKTVIIACVSPADTDTKETLNTLKYASHARNIYNKATVNHDSTIAQMQRMRSLIEQLQAELLHSHGEGSPFEELQTLRHKAKVLEVHNAELRQELREARIACDRLAQQGIGSQVLELENEEALMDTKRPTELLGARKSSHETPGSVNDNGPEVQVVENLNPSLDGSSSRCQLQGVGLDCPDLDILELPETTPLEIKKQKEEIDHPEKISEQKAASSASIGCCSCSSSSTCKTSKCKCRILHGMCGMHCTCKPSRCTNREKVRSINKSASTTTKRSIEVAGDNELQRQPLGDIGNTIANCNEGKPNKRRKPRK